MSRINQVTISLAANDGEGQEYFVIYLFDEALNFMLENLSTNFKGILKFPHQTATIKDIKTATLNPLDDDEIYINPRFITSIFVRKYELSNPQEGK